ncbi:hypothetical protein HOF40_02215 [Candidatus Parcubacteria bacterium]|jgi:hypothetical protein|nr:hypothetical protein [Candidatus Parcubacteria bacterium]MBT3948879.1 hypothetical protein [Candidatus Parcubacteria bacterium]
MTNTCGTDSCKMNHDGDGTIPKELKEKWNEFIEKNCPSVDCARRYTTKCCVWGEFEKTLK